MSNNIIDLKSKKEEIEENKPHVVLCVDKNGTDEYHIVPIACFTDIVKGKLALTDLEDYEAIMKVILEEWLSCMGYDG